MARRRQVLPTVDAELSESDFQALRMFGMASDPPWPGSSEIWAEAGRLQGTRLNAEERYRELLAFIVALGHREGLQGLGAAAERHVAHLRRARECWRAARPRSCCRSPGQGG
jgi:hypothetical protein